MTKQEVFDIVAKQLAAQNWEKSLANGSCAYRGVDGKKCAIGALLNDDDVVVHEGDTVFERWFDPILERLDLGLRGRGFLARLQSAHDLATSGNHMEAMLKNVGIAYRLEWPLGAD